jgi:hypothetical protein
MFDPWPIYSSHLGLSENKVPPIPQIKIITPGKDRPIGGYTNHFQTFKSGWWLSPSPLKNDGVSSSVGIMKFPIYGTKNVPNHQPEINPNHLELVNISYISY